MRQHLLETISLVEGNLAAAVADLRAAMMNIRASAEDRFSREMIEAIGPGTEIHPHGTRIVDAKWIEGEIGRARKHEMIVYGYQRQLVVLRELLRHLDEFEPVGSVAIDDVVGQMDQMVTHLREAGADYQGDGNIRYYEYGVTTTCRAILGMLGVPSEVIERHLDQG